MDNPYSPSQISLRQPLHNHTSSHPNSSPTSSDLPATISVLEDLTVLAESTLKSVSDFFSFAAAPSSAFLTLGRCPFDSRHLMPPESLFRHSLTCSSAPGSPLFDLDFLDNLRYTKSFKSGDQLLKENIFVRPLPEADICFSLDGELGEIHSNFFYKDCPGVVTTPEPDPTSRTFSLPSILSAECANFINDHDLGGGDLEQKAGILPSDFWVLRIEVESWSEVPGSYSFTALLVAMGLHKVDELNLKRWLILNSSRFGILIDAAMRDHIFLLLNLCWKVVRREAIFSLKLAFEEEGFLDSRVVRYECPQLVSSLTWLSFQISVLYGEMNGKLFVLGMLKESFLLVGRHLMLFTRENRQPTGVATECRSELSKSVENMETKISKPLENFSSEKVFVSQVASAIAALHERFLLEQRVTALRSSQVMPRYQLLSECTSASIRASQERAKRPNYRPLLEHDGLLWQRQNMLESGKSKTREELLAEERDYKRRRISYRGKKVKRNPLQVLHDIIEEHTEEIKKAGGIGCNVKIASGSTFVSKFDCERKKELLQSSATNAYETTIKRSLKYAGTSAVSCCEFDSSNDSSSGNTLRRSHHGTSFEPYEGQHELEKCKQETLKFRSRSPSYRSDYSCLNERHSQQKDQWSSSRFKHEGKDFRYPSSYDDYDSSSTLTSKSQASIKYEYDSTPNFKINYSNRVSEKQWVDSTRNDMFEDRYEPSRSNDNCDTFYEGLSEVCHSLGSKSYKLQNDTEQHDAQKNSYRHNSERIMDYHK